MWLFLLFPLACSHHSEHAHRGSNLATTCPHQSFDKSPSSLTHEIMKTFVSIQDIAHCTATCVQVESPNL